MMNICENCQYFYRTCTGCTSLGFCAKLRVNIPDTQDACCNFVRR